MVIIEWLAFGVFSFFTVGWLYGCRIKSSAEGVTLMTLATTFQMTVVLILMLTGTINKLHSIWLLPVLIVTSPANFLLMKLPVFGNVYTGFVRLFGKLIMIS